jgi:hypothetical protein
MIREESLNSYINMSIEDPVPETRSPPWKTGIVT